MSLVSEPKSLNFGVVPATDRPRSIDFALVNNSDVALVINFGEISSNSAWFTSNDSISKEQKLSGFDIFFNSGRLTTLEINRRSKVELSYVIIPSYSMISFPSVITIPYVTAGSDDVSFLEIPTTGKITEISFTISPKVLFLNDCCMGQPQTKTFELKNTSAVKLPIMIYSPEDVHIDTADDKNMVVISPNEVVSLTLHHTPKEIGQFEHKISFDCLLSLNIESKSMRLVTSVSPSEIPRNFPVISLDGSEIDFGEVNAGMSNEKQFTITNPGDDMFTVTIVAVVDLFANNDVIEPTASSSCVLMSNLNTSSPQTTFRSALSPNKESKLTLTLHPHSAISITMDYTPAFNLSADSAEFENRTFMTTLTFVDSQTHAIYYRRIKCKAAVCHSRIELSEEVIDFGDTIVGNKEKTASVVISNMSPMKTVVKVNPSSRSLVVSPVPIEIPGKSSYRFSFSFYPKRITPDYTASIKFTNLNNPSNEVHLDVAAIVVAPESEAIHSASYSIVCNGAHVTMFDFAHCAMNYPSVKSFTIKNRTANPLVVRFAPSSASEISVYQETSIPVSQSLGSIGNSVSLIPIFQEAPTLLSADDSTVTMKQLENHAKTNSSFYENMFSFLTQYSEHDIVEHFEQIAKQLETITTNGSIMCVNDTEIEIQPNSRQEIFIVLVPRAKSPKASLLWQHRIEKLNIHLVGHDDIQPLSIPIVFNVAQSSIFLSAHSLNFGTVQANTRHEHQINLVNESAIPLLFKLESNAVVFNKKTCGIIYPLSSYSIPFSLNTNLDGKLKENIVVRNILNPCEVETITLKGKVVKRSNFFLDTYELNFGDVTAGSSSQRCLVFITNTLSSENEITFSHVQKEVLTCKPLMSYQFKNINSRMLTESVRLQLEKLGCKLRILQRKKKHEYAAKIQRLIDSLSKTTVDNTAMELRRMDAKYMDRITFRIGPLQMVCIEFQLIPSVMAGKRLSIDIPLEGTVLVYERGRVDSQKVIKYKSHVVPETQRLLDSVVQKSIQVDPNMIVINDVYVHECVTKTIKMKNISNTQQNYWISSDSSNDCIISSPKAEGQLKTQEEQELPIDIFCLEPGTMTKQLAITTQTSTQTVMLQITAAYRELLVFPGLPENHTIDFGNVPLTSLQVIEERSAFNISNTSDKDLYVSILNDLAKDITIYENDPRLPQIRPFLLHKHSSVRMNLVLHPEIDPQSYHKYKSCVISGTLTIKAFETNEEAETAQDLPCLFASEIYITAAIGRIGIFCSDMYVDFGSVQKKEQEATVVVKNRSSHIPVDIITACSQGLSVEPQTFTLTGNKLSKPTQELTLKFKPSADGMNEAKLQLSLTSNAIPYTKYIKITAFVDPGILKTNLPKSSKGNDVLAIGPLYINNGRPVRKRCEVEFTNSSNIAVSVEMENMRMTLPAYKVHKVQFMFPFANYDYDPEEPKFSYRVYMRSLTTHRILKVIDIVGEFVISDATLITDVISLGKFGRINNWKYEHKAIHITNNSNIRLEMNVACSSSFLKLPTKIHADPLSDFALSLSPCIDNCEKEGPKVANIVFTNEYNPENVLRCSVSFDIRHSVLQLDRVTKVDAVTYEMMMRKFAQIVDGESERSGFYTANNWLSITNRLDDECVVEIEVEKCMENVQIEIFMRKTEIKIDSLDLQPNETVEIRVKTIVSDDHFDPNTKYLFAKVLFKSGDLEPVPVNVCFLADAAP